MSKRTGIIGGLSPASTMEYYLYLTHTYTQRFGNSAYPEVLIYSVSFQSYADWPTHTLGVGAAPKGSSWAALRSCCWSTKLMPGCRYLTPPPSTPAPLWSMHFEIKRNF
jgi:hypothetical protein